jgi:plastocyanin
MRRRTFLAATAAGTTALAGCGMVGGSGDADVEMVKNAYVPETLEAAVGDPVVWVNNGSRGPTGTAYEDGLPEGAAYWASGGFDSEAAARDDWTSSGQDGKLVPGNSYEHTFEVPGLYNYFCIPHEEAGMVGVIRVEQQGGNRS